MLYHGMVTLCRDKSITESYVTVGKIGTAAGLLVGLVARFGWAVVGHGALRYIRDAGIV